MSTRFSVRLQLKFPIQTEGRLHVIPPTETELGPLRLHAAFPASPDVPEVPE